jgi:hypothetical protein
LTSFHPAAFTEVDLLRIVLAKYPTGCGAFALFPFAAAEKPGYECGDGYE